MQFKLHSQMKQNGHWNNYSWLWHKHNKVILSLTKTISLEQKLQQTTCNYEINLKNRSVHPNICKHVLQEVNGSAENSPTCKWNHWQHFYLKGKKNPLSIHVFKSQSFSKLEAGTLLAAPGCGGTATAGSLGGHCCWRTEQVGMGWCGRWLGLYTLGQTRWRLGDTSRTQGRTGMPVEINPQVELLHDSLENSQTADLCTIMWSC